MIRMAERGRTTRGVPGGLICGPRVYRDQFRGFKYYRGHTRKAIVLNIK